MKKINGKFQWKKKMENAWNSHSEFFSNLVQIKYFFFIYIIILIQSFLINDLNDI